ncbi:MAG TPA: lytic transglycosylase domain-containing protein [Terriglobales bacterium]|nr:lytic transglycosylase domain-containing protein [Terriglobales bacterium]
MRFPSHTFTGLLQSLRPQLGDATASIDLRQAIFDEANAQNVPAGIALAIATRESGIMQWRPDGSLVTGAAGEIGIFQLMPSTADALGVDPTDPMQNIQGGVKYLAEMFAQFGSWPLAIAAYNWGPKKVSKQLAAGNDVCSFPSSVRNYVAFVVGSGVLAQCAIAVVASKSNPGAAAISAPVAPAVVAQPGKGLSSGATVAAAVIGITGLVWALFD